MTKKASVVGQPAAEWVDVAKLKPWARNPRKNARAVKVVVESIRAFGWGAPIIARQENGEIVAGHTRHLAVPALAAQWKAASVEERKTWHTEAAEIARTGRVPVRYVDLTEQAAHALALADNRAHEFSGWEDAQLREVLESLDASDRLAAGFDDDYLEALREITDPLELDGEGNKPTPDAQHACPKCGFKF